MKQIKRILMLFVGVVFLFASCNKEEITIDESEVFYKTELKRIINFKELSTGYGNQDVSKKGSDFKTFKEAYVFFSALKKGISVLDTVRVTAVKPIERDGKNAPSNLGVPDQYYQASCRSAASVQNSITGSVQSIFNVNFRVRYTEVYEGIWLPEVFAINPGNASFTYDGLFSVPSKSGGFFGRRCIVNMPGTGTVVGYPFSFTIQVTLDFGIEPSLYPWGEQLVIASLKAVA